MTTVGELKRILADLADDVPVLVEVGGFDDPGVAGEACALSMFIVDDPGDKSGEYAARCHPGPAKQWAERNASDKATVRLALVVVRDDLVDELS